MHQKLRIMKPARERENAFVVLSEEELFEAFLRGSDDAFVELHRRLQPRLLMYAGRMLDSDEGAQDVAQTVWERVIGMRRKPPSTHSPVGLIITITRNLCLDLLKSPRRRQVPLELLRETEHPVTDGPGEMAEIVEEELRLLPLDAREVLVMNIYMGYRFDEIAAMIGKTPEAIWTRASRARSELRRRIARRIERTDEGAAAAQGKNS